MMTLSFLVRSLLPKYKEEVNPHILGGWLEARRRKENVDARVIKQEAEKFLAREKTLWVVGICAIAVCLVTMILIVVVGPTVSAVVIALVCITAFLVYSAVQGHSYPTMEKFISEVEELEKAMNMTYQEMQNGSARVLREQAELVLRLIADEIKRLQEGESNSPIESEATMAEKSRFRKSFAAFSKFGLVKGTFHRFFEAIEEV